MSDDPSAAEALSAADIAGLKMMMPHHREEWLRTHADVILVTFDRFLDRERAAAPDWPTLANIIREVDGNHDLGAGELAERILAHPRFDRERAEAALPTLDVERLDTAFREMADRGWLRFPDGHGLRTYTNVFLEAYGRAIRSTPEHDWTRAAHVHNPVSRPGDTNAYCSSCGFFPLPEAER